MAVRVAVVVGINYVPSGPDISPGPRPLRFAEADAQAMTDLLREEGFAVTCLLGPAAGRAAIRAAVEQHSHSLGPDGLLLVYFSGHGALDPAQTAYLLPADVDHADLVRTAIPIQELAEAPQATTGIILTLLDCCHSGYPLGLSGSAPVVPTNTDRGQPIATHTGAEAFRRQVRTMFQMFPGRVVLAACAGHELARELAKFGHGVFTYYMLDHWRYTADVDVQSLFRYTDIMLEQAGLPRPVFWESPTQGRLVLHYGVASRRLRIPFAHNPFFIGRDDDLVTLDEAIAHRATPALTGMAGVGKSQLAAEFAYRVRDRFPGGVFWLTMDPPEGIAGQVAGYAGHNGLNLPGAEHMPFEEQVAAVQAAWEEPIPRLLIFDNLENPELLVAWRPRTGDSQVLVTSRRLVWGTALEVTPLPVRELARAASQSLLVGLRARAAGTLPDTLLADPVTAAAADAICEALGDLPLPLAVAGAYLEAVLSVRLDRYLARLQAAPLPDPALLTGLDEPLPTGHEPSITATFALSYDELDLTRPNNMRARTLLHRAAQCAPTPIPARLLQRLADLDPDSDSVEEDLALALRRLATLGLITPLPDGTARLHRLLGAYVRSRAPDPAGDAAAVEEALTIEVAAINEIQNPQPGTPYLEHLRQAVAVLGERSDVPAANILYELALLLHYRGEYAAARPLFERALVIREQVLGPDDPETAVSLDRVATVLHYQGDLAAARPLLERALAIKEQALGPTHPRTATSLNNLALLLYQAGDLAAARPLYERAAASLEQTLGPIHPHTAQSLNNLAQLLYDQKDYAAARPLFERALAIYEQTLGPAHPNTASTLNESARLEQAEENYDAARPLYERAIAIYEQALGPTHPDLAPSLNNLAGLLEAQGDYAAARPLFERAVAIVKQALGPDHPWTRKIQGNLMRLLDAMGAGERE